MSLSSRDLLLHLLDYTAWGRDRILTAAAGLTDDELRAPCGLDHGGILATLTHTLWAQMLLHDRWLGASARRLAEADIASLDHLQDLWSIESDAVRESIRALTDEGIQRPVEYTTQSGANVSEPIWQHVMQMVTHSTQHRSEVALALTHLGHSPGFLDYLGFVRESSH